MSGSCFYIFINAKQKDIRVYFKNCLFGKPYPLQILSTYTPLAHSSHPLCSACLFSTSTPLRSLILHIHSVPLTHSPHPLHPLLYSFRQKKKNAHETEFPYQFHPLSSCLQVQVSTLCSHQNRQICVC